MASRGIDINGETRRKYTRMFDETYDDSENRVFVTADCKSDNFKKIFHSVHLSVARMHRVALGTPTAAVETLLQYTAITTHASTAIQI